MRLTDSADIRTRLERERIWAAFSIADLDEPYAAHTHWFGTPGSDALLLVYDAFDPPIVYLQGSADECESLLADPAVRAKTAHAWLNVQPAHEAAVRPSFVRFDARRMVRMALDLALFSPITVPGLIRLGPEDLHEVDRLYGEDRPAFFMPSQLEHGVYYGVRESGRLLSVAGTHVVSEAGGVGALGNVYTNPECRGRGLAAAATSAVARELLDRGMRTVVLNIVATNDPARRVYERLGFRDYCTYEEGLAVR